MEDLRPTDFLPRNFSGENIDHDTCHAHYLSFLDYLMAHDLHEPNFGVEMINVTILFKTTLVRQARLWAEGKVFTGLEDLRDQFLHRFSPTHSHFGHRNYSNRSLQVLPHSVCANAYRCGKLPLPAGIVPVPCV